MRVHDPLGLEELETERRPIPKPVLGAAAALILATLLLTLYSVKTGQGRVVAGGVDAPPAAETLALTFDAPEEEGEIRIRRAEDGAVLSVLEPGEGGFVRGMLRPLNRERVRHGRALDEPYLLRRNPDGRLTLVDKAMRLTIDIRAFGASSDAHFQGLLAAARRAP